MDRTAEKQLQAERQVASWNRTVAVGSRVTYFKSDTEGRVVLETAAAAYLLGSRVPAIELTHVGTALLDKVQPFSG